MGAFSCYNGRVQHQRPMLHDYLTQILKSLKQMEQSVLPETEHLLPELRALKAEAEEWLADA